MAPVANRFMISVAGSTSSSGTGGWPAGRIDAADPQQPAQREQPGGLVVDQPGVVAEDVLAAAAGGVLELEHGLRAEQVRLALAPPLVLAAGLQPPVRQAAAAGREGPLVPEADLGGQLGEAHPAQRRGGPGEAGLDDLGAEPDGLEDLRAGIRGDGGHAHLGHDLEQALAQRLDQPLLGQGRADIAEHAAAGQLGHGVQGQVGAHGGGAVPDEQREVMAFAGVARLDDQPDPGPGPLPDQVMVHRSGQQQAGDRRQAVVIGCAAVGQHDEPSAVGYSLRDLAADLRQPAAQAGPARRDGVAAVDHVGGEAGHVAVVVDVHDLGQVGLADHRVGQHDLAAGRGPGVEQVVLGPDRGPQRGDQLLPDGVQRRVGDLREQLGEVVEQQPRPVRQDGQRRVGAHGADRLGPGARHGRQHHPQLLLGVAEGLLLGDQLAAVRRDARAPGELVQVHPAGVQPVLVRELRGQARLDLLVLQDASGGGVGQEDPARLEPALAHDRGRVQVQHADLAGQHDQAVLGDPVPARPQPVAVEHRADHGAVGEGDQRRAVPRLHERAVEVVEGPAGRVHPRRCSPTARGSS